MGATRRALAAVVIVSACLVALGGGAVAFQVAGWGETPEAEIDAAVDDVLSQAAYGGESTNPLLDNPLTRFLVDLWEGFVDWFGSLFPEADPREAPDVTPRGVGRSSFGVVLVLGLVLLAAIVAARVARSRARTELEDFSADPTGALSSDDLVTSDSASTPTTFLRQIRGPR